MEQIITVHVEKLPAGIYLATSDEVQGLVAQGRTIAETLKIARDVARSWLRPERSARASQRRASTFRETP